MSLDWPNQPSLLIGRNVEVEWKDGKMSKGKVVAYNPSTKRFSILFGDHEERECDLLTKTFQIVSSCLFLSNSCLRKVKITFGLQNILVRK